ncbi:MAG: leucine-rich repeat protein [Bacteroidetes bacterium]|nr:leucine-rich repeat protein [Bacteroidota bacterium]
MNQKITKNSVQWWRPFQRNASNPRGLKFLITTIFFGLGVMSAFGQSYNAAGAVAYSNKWTNEIDTKNTKSTSDDATIRKGEVDNGLQNKPNYHNKDYAYCGTLSNNGQYSNDCANFVSQCLVRGGGLNQNAYKPNPDGHIINCVPLHEYLRATFPNAEYATSTVTSNGPTNIPSWLAPGDIVIWWDRGVGLSKGSGSNHTAIVATNDKLLNAHTSNRHHKSLSWFKNGSSWSYISYYHISENNPVSNVIPNVSNERPRIDIAIPNNSFTNNIKIMHGGRYNNEEVIISVGNANTIGRDNIKIVVKGINGEPAYSDDDPQAYYGTTQLRFFAGDRAPLSANQWFWSPNPGSVAWDNKWVKIIAVNTRGYDNNVTDANHWNSNWIQSEPRYVRIVPQNITANDLYPLITTIDNQTVNNNNIYDVNAVPFSNDISFIVDGRGYVGDNSYDAWENDIGISYVILNGTPNYSDPYVTETPYSGINGTYKFFTSEENHDATVKEKFHLYPETRSEWEGRYVKIMPWNTQYSIWGKARYIKIIPTLETLTVSHGTLLPIFDPDITHYTVDVPNNVTSIDISASAHSLATTITKKGMQNNLQVGNDNTIEIEVIGNNGASKKYTIIVTRDVGVTTPPRTPDSYEPNNTQVTASNLSVNFSGNSATVNTLGSNFHTSSDVDYYKIELPVGYNYTVTPQLHDTDNSSIYTVDAKFSYSRNGGSAYSSSSDNHSAFSVENGGTLYFKVEPYSSGDMGTYLLSINIIRTEVGVQPPTVITLRAEDVLATSATLKKEIIMGSEQIPNPNQGFEYRIKGTEQWFVSTTGNLIGLTANTTYQFRAYATTVRGVTTYGDILEFITEDETAPSWEVGTPIASDVIATLKNGVLTIKGTGAMQDFTSTNNLPWSSFINSTWNKLTGVVIEDGVTNIGKNAFRAVVNLSSVSIGNTVTDIGEYAFFQCTALSSITIPNSVTTIRQSAFSGCSNLSAIVIPNSVTSIGLYAFSNCSNLSSVSFGNGITNIGNYSFQNCNGLTTITIPESVAIVGYGAFQNSVGLQSVYFNATNCTSVGPKDYPAFSGCTNITTAHIGSNVTNIPAYAFSGCNITEIYSKATVAPATRANSFDGIDRKTCKLYVLTCAVANEYRSNTEWNGFSSIFAEGATVPCVIEPNTISLNSAKISLSIDETKSLTITVSPSNASKSNIQWSSNNPNVATVSNEGLITAVAVGTATITATTANGKTATCMVTVSPSTGIDDITTSDLLVYPNPTTGIVNISEPSEIKVYNSFGALLITTFGTQVDLSNYANGVYFIQVNGKRISVVKR